MKVQLLPDLTLLLVGILEYVNWWCGVNSSPLRCRELAGRFRLDKRHSVPLIVNFQNHYKKSKKSNIGDPVSKNFQKFRDFNLITKNGITSLFIVRF